MLDIPNIPFTVYYEDYKKTVHVVGSCEADTWQSETYVLRENEKLTVDFIKSIVNKAFDTPGVTKVKICRVELHEK